MPRSTSTIWQHSLTRQPLSFTRPGYQLKRQPGLFQEIQKFRRGFRYRMITELFPLRGDLLRGLDKTASSDKKKKASKGAIQKFVELNFKTKGQKTSPRLERECIKLQTQSKLLKSCLLKEIHHQ